MEGIREYQQTVDGNPESRKRPWNPIGWVFAFDIANQNDNGTNPELYRHGLRLTSNRAQDDNSRIVAMALAFSQPAGPALDTAGSGGHRCGPMDADHRARKLVRHW